MPFFDFIYCEFLVQSLNYDGGNLHVFGVDVFELDRLRIVS